MRKIVCRRGNSSNGRMVRGWMRSPLLLAGPILAAVTGMVFSSQPQGKPGETEPNREQAAALIRQALEKLDPSAPDAASRLAELGRQAAGTLGDGSLVAADLLAAGEEAGKPGVDLSALVERFEKIGKLLAFRPLMEAELPRGFPAPGPAGEIRVKDYPAYRMAVSRSGGTAFWSLFGHIKRREIAMTAPVEMRYDDAEDANPKEQTMAFLYGDPELGQAGPDGSVEVVDAQPLTVVSIGMTGSRSDASIQRCRDQLADWLARHPEYEVSGSLRVLAYNSPFVPRDRQYWEVQLPIRTKSAEAKRSSATVPAATPPAG
ncbi:MAG: heme-binding protein [Thermoguttaceae bacterium]